MRLTAIALAVVCTSTLAAGQTPEPAANPLVRHYSENEALTYRMTGMNDDWHYSVQADGGVKKNADGIWMEEFRWSNMTSNGQPVALTPASVAFREVLSLDPTRNPSGPDLSNVDPRLVGPVTDLMTFYVDLWLANKIGILRRPGDHFYVPNPMPSSWADGTRVLTGQDHIDFDLTLQSVDAAKHTALLVVHHVPPAHPNVTFAAAWMQAPVAGTPNNWVEVAKTSAGKFQAGVGKETFDVSITVSTVDGKILAASMENPVVTISRICDDAALTQCTDPKPHTIHRHVEIALAP